MSEIEKLNVIAEWQEQHKQLIEDLDKSRKRIAELEHQLIHRNCLDCSNHSSKLRMKVLELEKENAELKSGCGMCYRKDKEKLVEARELLKRWLRLYNTNTVKGIIADTEQFIKE